MQLIAPIILGLVQGLTEFLPVSSTAHLILIPWAFGWDDPVLNSLTFDVALHLGTLVAVLVYFRADWVRLIRAFFTSIARRGATDPWGRLAWLIVIATIPGAVLGALFEHDVETVFRSPALIAFTLVFVGVLMIAAERASKRGAGTGIFGMKPGHAVLIGIAQAAALVPGVSRSGATITAGLWAGYRREDAARFSFLLSTPIIAGACVLKLRHVLHGMPPGEGTAFAAGAAASAVSGYAAIAFLISYLKRHPLNLFAYYRFALAAVIAALLFIK